MLLVYKAYILVNYFELVKLDLSNYRKQGRQKQRGTKPRSSHHRIRIFTTLLSELPAL